MTDHANDPKLLDHPLSALFGFIFMNLAVVAFAAAVAGLLWLIGVR